MKILIIDNYDSFTYNLYQLIGEVLGGEKSHSGATVGSDRIWSDVKRSYRGLRPLQDDNFVDVFRNDKITLQEIERRKYDGIVVSPGPGNPTNSKDFGISREVILTARIPILGVCLGHQGIGAVFGSHVVHAPEVVHGRISKIYHTGEGLFKDIPQGFDAVRYHSLMLKEVPGSFTKTAWTKDNILMGIAHISRPLWGVQFHPESIGTAYGKQILANFLEEVRKQ